MPLPGKKMGVTELCTVYVTLLEVKLIEISACAACQLAPKYMAMKRRHSCQCSAM